MPRGLASGNEAEVVSVTVGTVEVVSVTVGTVEAPLSSVASFPGLPRVLFFGLR